MGEEGFIGGIRIFAGNFAPRNWAFCEGQLLAISQNTALFSILGTTYGGDGRTTFGLPDLRGRAAIGAGNGPGLSPVSLGQKTGNYQTVLNVQNLPAHSHVTQVQVSTDDAEESNSNGGKLAKASNYNEDASSGAHLNGVTGGNTGNNQGFNNQQPYLPCYYVICLQGIFPSRN